MKDETKPEGENKGEKVSDGEEENADQPDAEGDERKSGEGVSENSNEEELEEDGLKNRTLAKAALELQAAPEEKPALEFFLDGTLKSDGVPILIKEDVNPDDVSITVWKIESPIQLPDETEEHVVYEDTADGIKTTRDSQTVENNINYIIKIGPSQEKYFNLIDGAEKKEHNDQSYNVATQGNKVTLQINVPSGYTLKKAYGDDGKEVELKKDAAGVYFVEVPMGGGVYLNAELVKNKTGGDSSSGGGSSSSDSSYYDYGWSGVSVSVVTPAKVKPTVQEDDCSFTFDCDGTFVVFKLNGGTLAGTGGPIIIPAEIGELFALLQAPVRPGFRFSHWEPCCPKITATLPGQTFTVMKTVVFIAIWEAADGRRSGGTGYMDYQTGAVSDDDDDDEDDGPDRADTVIIDKDNDEELNLNSITVEKLSEQAIGIDITASQDVDVDDAIKVTGGDSGAVGVRANASGQSVNMEVETGDGMSVSSSGHSVGIQASASGGNSVTLEFEGNVEAASSGSGGSSGVEMSAESGSSVSVTVTGDVTSSDGPGLVLGEP
ncbi:MAG: hypothetical protein IKO00_06060 [Oscillospiraceae bacterium]|nr:hypothetical protein [Oscillospiraceae bacterium]